ncbi:MAG: hypothetical protein FJ368_04095 [Pelagibacterales bacterium]|nr:hypothetical protein [Pelagibacterales bacterium]
MNDKKACQHAYFPAIVLTLAGEAIARSKNDDEKQLIDNLAKIAAIVYKSYAPSLKLIKRVSRAVHATLSLFVDARDNTYHIRKVFLALFGATQTALDEDLIDNNIALVVQDALNIEGKAPMADEDWLKLKASADKKVKEIMTILKNI